ncbi:transposase [Rothia nasimurium]|uniref:Transposase n=1 Tax=Rothia nasimurium TaxID=85336 RepID=A0A1Y1RPR6_9MICC|nr:transposon-encoded TnpW family protein [Rothia nasimurium]ORC18839.1 transposase [Rothia nasimurium]
MEEGKREIKAPPHKQLIMDIGKTKYTVNLHFKQGTGETYKDKILRLIKRETEKI